MKRIRAIVSGRVQGVSYRASTVREAKRLGLVGWVKNRPDGSVELEAEGPGAAVDELIAWCHRGPAYAEVSGVRVEDVPGTGDERRIADGEFRIVH